MTTTTADAPGAGRRELRRPLVRALITLFKGQPKDVQAEIIRITRTHGTMLCRSR